MYLWSGEEGQPWALSEEPKTLINPMEKMIQLKAVKDAQNLKEASEKGEKAEGSAEGNK